MQLYLPQKKLTDLQSKCQSTLHAGRATVRKLAKLVGQMSAAVKSILPALLQYRHLQMLKTKALYQANQSYDAIVTLTPECKSELQWWIQEMPRWNGKTFLKPSPALAVEITTDASRKGWGAHCAEMHTQGLWSQEELKLHVNALEMKAAFFVLKAFTKERKMLHVHLRVDNTTTAAYINKMGGTRSQTMIEITKELWNFCLEKQITLTAEYLPGRNNQVADRESRDYRDRSNWMLRKDIFRAITERMGMIDIDLFADRNKCADNPICELEARSGRDSDGCIHYEMEEPESIHFSTILPDRTVSSQGQTRASHNNNGDPHMAHTTMVCRSAGDVRGGSLTTARGSRPSDVTNRGDTSTDRAGPHASGMENFRGPGESEVLSETARKLLGNACRESSKSTYDSPLNWLAQY